jgi:hypothetical protein
MKLKGLHREGIDKRGNIHIVSENGETIAIILKNKENLKYSRLIAQAPEMLEALIESVIEAKKCMEIPYHLPDEEKVDKWKKFIEKATGLTIEEVLNGK